MPQSSEQIEAKLCAYLEGELDEQGRAEIEKHLAGNPAHRKLLAEVAGTRDLLRALPRDGTLSTLPDGKPQGAAATRDAEKNSDQELEKNNPRYAYVDGTPRGPGAITEGGVTPGEAPASTTAPSRSRNLALAPTAMGRDT